MRKSLFSRFPASLLASVLVCLATPPDDRQVLKAFYRDIRPWGFWRPILEELRSEQPDLEPNRNFRLDMLNVANGIVWQLSLMAAPMCLVVRQYEWMWASIGVLAVTSVIMKRLWYDRLEPAEEPTSKEDQPAAREGTA